MADEIELGPIDFLVVEWPKDSPPKGEAFPYLVDLVDRGIIRIMDLAFVEKDEQGNVAAIDISDMDLDGNPEIAVFEGVASGLIDEEDKQDAGNVMEPGTHAAVLVYENTWAAPFATALRKGGAQLVAQGRIPVNDIIAQLDALEAAEG
jgi:hypothetical protein